MKKYLIIVLLYKILLLLLILKRLIRSKLKNIKKKILIFIDLKLLRLILTILLKTCLILIKYLIMKSNFKLSIFFQFQSLNKKIIKIVKVDKYINARSSTVVF